MVCHSRAANFVLGLNTLQMNKVHNYGKVSDNQLRTLEHLGVFGSAVPPPDGPRPATKLPKSPADYPRLADPYDSHADLETRVRSYLHANCSICHVPAGGGNAAMDLDFQTKPNDMKMIGARPLHDSYGVANAQLIAPGAPERSILYLRLARRGPGQMPPLATARADEQAVQLLEKWIRQMKPGR